MKTTINVWYLDSGCSKHMIGDKDKFSSLVLKTKGFVTYGDNIKGNILGMGKVETPPLTTIEDVLYVEVLKHNLLNVRQLCDKGLKVNFTKNECIIEDEVTHDIKFIGKIINNIFMIYLDDLCLKIKCLVVINDYAWLWHKRIAHIHMEHLNKLVKIDLVISSQKMKYKKDILCDACQKGKEIKSTFKPKNMVSTTRPLQRIHMDWFDPSRIRRF